MNENFFEPIDTPCPSCNGEVMRRDCTNCNEGYTHHDCGEDCCSCADPEDNVPCDLCHGKGYLLWCSSCGKDLRFKQQLETEA